MSSDHLREILVNKYGDNYEQQIGDNVLTVFHLGNNQINDLSPLQNLTSLLGLYLRNNQISDLTPLQNLTSLKLLSLENNQINDLSPLQNLTSLEKLYLSGNQISDLTPLQNLTGLEWLDLDNNQIQTGPKNLKDLKLLQRVKSYYWIAWLKIRLSRFHHWVHEMKKWYLIDALYGKPDAYFRLIDISD